MKKIAIVKIAGKGTRINSAVPKQYIEVNGRPIFVYTLMPFNESENVDGICLVCDEKHVDFVKRKCKEFGLSKVRYFCVGGKNGNSSTFNGFKFIEKELDDDDIIISHDGVRALVTKEIIEDSIEAAKACHAAVASYATSGNVLIKNSEYEYIGRDKVMIAQTPISLSKTIMKKCCDFFGAQSELIQEKYAGLDDIVFSLGIPMRKSKGSSLNFKITTNDDLAMFKAIIGKR